MSTHYGVKEATALVDGNEYTIRDASVSKAFGPDLSHPFIVSFPMKCNIDAYNAIKPDCRIEFDGIDAVVDVMQVNPFVLARDTDSMVSLGLIWA